ncbi:hypothetical protein FRB98_003426 [Tulasnella sp. 332]|nr:hypothetical protein FRB98_003426 [Tulasnella sp. 332]
MGWIFTKPIYERMSLVDKSDLEHDEVPMALSLGLILPALIASLWNDALGGFIWGGIVTRLIGWHCTFSVNSLAHWEGLQPYTDEITARGSLILALLTSGEGNHNFHAFPQDYRAGPSPFDWDPCKWVITILHRHTNLIPAVQRAKDEDVRAAEEHMRERRKLLSTSPSPFNLLHERHGYSEMVPEVAPLRSDVDVALDVWDATQLYAYIETMGDKAVVLVIDGWVVDATRFASEHPGGALLLKKFAVRPPNNDDRLSKLHRFAGEGSADWAFHTLNDHSRNARRKLGDMRLAKLKI